MKQIMFAVMCRSTADLLYWEKCVTPCLALDGAGQGTMRFLEVALDEQGKPRFLLLPQIRPQGSQEQGGGSG